MARFLSGLVVGLVAAILLGALRPDVSRERRPMPRPSPVASAVPAGDGSLLLPAAAGYALGVSRRSGRRGRR